VTGGSSTLRWDGTALSRHSRAAGRRFRADPRCFGGVAVHAWAHVCALPDEDARLPYDDPAVQAARRDALAWWIPLLGDALVCLTTLALDSVNCGGAITVATEPSLFVDDPFTRLFPGRIVETAIFAAVPPPAGPVIERYSGAAWPGGSFA
jgi:hypothetical protein